MTINWDKPLQIKNGRKVRILCRDRQMADGLTVLGLIKENNGIEWIASWDQNGKHHDGDGYDLMNVPQFVYANVYKNGPFRHSIGTCYATRQEALDNKDVAYYVKTIEIEV